MAFFYYPMQFVPVSAPNMPFYPQFPVNTSTLPALAIPERVSDQNENVSRPSSASKALPFSIETVLSNPGTSRSVSNSSSSAGTVSPDSSQSSAPQMIFTQNPVAFAPFQPFLSEPTRTKISSMKKCMQERMEAQYKKNMNYLIILETSFFKNIYPADSEIVRLCHVLGRSARTVQYWFSCRRMKLLKIINYSTLESPKHIIFDVQKTSGSSIFTTGQGTDSVGRVWSLKERILLRIA